MGSPVSPVVANLCMKEIEECAIYNATVKPKIWKRYVDNGYCVIKKNAVSRFRNTLNSVDPAITFTVEHEERNATLPRHIDLPTQRQDLN